MKKEKKKETAKMYCFHQNLTRLPFSTYTRLW